MTGRLAALGCAAAVAVETAATPTGALQQPTFRSGINYVRADVYPTRNGKPVADLRDEDFELLEDGRPQRIDSVQLVSVAAGGRRDARPEPSSVAGVEAALAGARGRIFILFLDASHVTTLGSGKIGEPLIRLIDRLVGPEDLIAVMTAETRPTELVLGRKTDVIERSLRTHRDWGRRFDRTRLDEREQLYRDCYQTLRHELIAGRQLSEMAQMMIDRRRERQTLEALNDLVRYLGGMSELRKTIVTVTEGWMLFKPEEAMLAPRQHLPDEPTRTDPVPGQPGVVVRDGTLRTAAKDDRASAMYACETDRLAFATFDDDAYFKELIGNANRWNASFYTVDPRGLAVFDAEVGVDRPSNVNLPSAWDRYTMRTSQGSMRVLADNTDGLSVIDMNDLDKGLARMADDLTSYYLLGYYSTNAKQDGTFREITVRVRRPGVDVRARRGYRAASTEEAAAAKPAAAAAPVPAIVSTIASAIGALDRLRSASRFHVNAVPGAAEGTSVSTLWVAGELLADGAPVTVGATAEIDVSGAASGTAQATLAGSDRSFLVGVPLSKPIDAGKLDVKVRLAGQAALGDSVTLDLAAAAGRPLLFRRGPSTGNRVQPAGAFQFSRTERVHLEVPLTVGAKPGSGRLLDRNGQALAIPIAIGERTDAATSARWLTADLTLAPLAPADYLIEIAWQAATGEQKTLTAIRVTR